MAKGTPIPKEAIALRTFDANQTKKKCANAGLTDRPRATLAAFAFDVVSRQLPFHALARDYAASLAAMTADYAARANGESGACATAFDDGSESDAPLLALLAAAGAAVAGDLSSSPLLTSPLLPPPSPSPSSRPPLPSPTLPNLLPPSQLQLHLYQQPMWPPHQQQDASLGHLGGVAVRWETFCVRCFGFSTEVMHFLKPLEHLIGALGTPHRPAECFCAGQPDSFGASLVRIASRRRTDADGGALRGALAVGAGDGQKGGNGKSDDGGPIRHQADLERRMAVRAGPLRLWEADWCPHRQLEGAAEGSPPHHGGDGEGGRGELPVVAAAHAKGHNAKKKNGKKKDDSKKAKGDGVVAAVFDGPPAFFGHASDTEPAAVAKSERFFSAFATPNADAPAHSISVSIVHKDPGSWPRGGGGGGGNRIVVGRAMFEATTLPGDWLRNRRSVDEVWVPTRFSRYIFEKEGFDPSRLVVIPEPIDVHYFDPSAAAPAILPQALHAAHWAHAGNREGADALMAGGEPPLSHQSINSDAQKGGKDSSAKEALLSPLEVLRNDLAALSSLGDGEAEMISLVHGGRGGVNVTSSPPPPLPPPSSLLSSVAGGLSANYKFLGVFKWEERKAWQVLISAYCRAFSAADPVSLYLVTYRYGDGGRSPHGIVSDVTEFVRSIERGPGFSDGDGGARPYRWPNAMPHIEVITEQVTDAEMVTLYRSADAFVMPTRGEGWGLPVIQAMSMGLPTITTAFSGMLDFADDGEDGWVEGHGASSSSEQQRRKASRNNMPYRHTAGARPLRLPPAPAATAFLIPYRLMTVRPGSGVGEGNVRDQGPMQWADPDGAALEQIMRFVFENPDEAEAVGQRARAHVVAHYSEEAIAETVKARLRFLREEKAAEQRLLRMAARHRH